MFKAVIFACVCIFIQTLCSKEVGVPQFEIRDGNCSNATVKDLVFQQHVHLSRRPFMSREDTVSITIPTYFIVFNAIKLRKTTSHFNYL